MPLSNDFDKSRLEFLKKQIKNNETVAAQFYPRCQREYNEMFPFTEGSVQNILQSQQQVVNDAVPVPNMELIEDDLEKELNGLTKNDTVSDCIIYSLSQAEVYYYSKNFNSINKELLKKVKLPISKEEFVIILNTIFNSDKHRTDIAAIGFFNLPPGLAPPIGPPAPPAGPPAPPVGPPAPPAGPPVGPPVPPAGPPAPGPPIPPPRAKTRSKTFSVPANIQLLIDQLNIIKKTKTKLYLAKKKKNLAILPNRND